MLSKAELDNEYPASDSIPRYATSCFMVAFQGCVPLPTYSRRLRTFFPSCGLTHCAMLTVIPRRLESSCLRASCRMRLLTNQNRCRLGAVIYVCNALE